MATSDAIHVVNMPSIPPGWTAGKWGEWYADMDGGRQPLTTGKPKPYWQSGWRLQHDRLLPAASAPRGTHPAVHQRRSSFDRRRSESFERPASICETTPSLLCCPGPWAPGVPGGHRWCEGCADSRAQGLDVEEGLPALEENGFSIFDFTPERVTMRYFRWKLGQPEAALDTLEPFRVTQLGRTRGDGNQCGILARAPLMHRSGDRPHDADSTLRNLILSSRTAACFDPESGLDGIRNIGISGRRVAAISPDRLTGRATIDAAGLVVAPGFIDLHAHGQTPDTYAFQARDGVTTALELEVGTSDIGGW